MYFFDKVTISQIGRLLQVVSRSACIFLTFLFFFCSFFFKNWGLVTALPKLVTALDKNLNFGNETALHPEIVFALDSRV